MSENQPAPARPGKAAAISIIVPVRNEAPLLKDFLRQLKARAPEAEVIVVDGESTDTSAAIAEENADRVLIVPPGRSQQANAGAAVASGEIFWFLHADTQIPAGAISEIRSLLRDPSVAGGHFRIQLPRDHFVYRLTDEVAHYAGKIMRIRCGDHGFFCRREVFDTIGGFPNVPLMGDVEFFRGMQRLGRVVSTQGRLIISPRQYEQVGAIKLTFAYGLIATLYFLGVPLPKLRRLYQQTCITV